MKNDDLVGETDAHRNRVSNFKNRRRAWQQTRSGKTDGPPGTKQVSFDGTGPGQLRNRRPKC